jgi:SAM-dependent methyltransferase
MKSGAVSLVELSALAPRDFVQTTYDAILGRPPTSLERDEMLSALMLGDARTWLVGKLRYSAEGRSRGTDVPGLRTRYVAQRLFRVPGIGPVLQWINAVARLPSSLRHLRAIMQIDTDRHEQMRQRDLARIVENERLHDQLRKRCEDAIELVPALERRHNEFLQVHRQEMERIALLDRSYHDLSERASNIVSRVEAEAKDRRADHARVDTLEARLTDIVSSAEAESKHRHADRARIDMLEGRFTDLSGMIERDRHELGAEVQKLDASFQTLGSKVDSIFPPALDEVLEIRGEPLVSLAKERFGLSREAPLSTLTRHERYSMFETVFYESPAVAAKQRIYVPYLNRELARQWPFLDLGCGRGEFLRILRDEGIGTVGVDINPTGITRLRAEGFDVVEQDLITFLENDPRTYCGASLLQVAEHLTDNQIERMLALVAARLAPGAVFIVETPNPISGFALSVFHTDSTHVRPLPPERMRYEIEAAGFEETRTLFQARIPLDQFAGPDPRAYYADYAIIASRSSSSR